MASSTIYGGTFNLISVTMKKMGVDVTFVSPLCTDEELEAAFRHNTKAVFGETIANPAPTCITVLLTIFLRVATVSLSLVGITIQIIRQV